MFQLPGRGYNSALKKRSGLMQHPEDKVNDKQTNKVDTAGVTAATVAAWTALTASVADASVAAVTNVYSLPHHRRNCVHPLQRA